MKNILSARPDLETAKGEKITNGMGERELREYSNKTKGMSILVLNNTEIEYINKLKK